MVPLVGQCISIIYIYILFKFYNNYYNKKIHIYYYHDKRIPYIIKNNTMIQLINFINLHNEDP